MSHVHPHLRKFNVLFYSFFLKLIPCIILTLVTALLVKAMVQVLGNFYGKINLQPLQ